MRLIRHLNAASARERVCGAANFSLEQTEHVRSKKRAACASIIYTPRHARPKPIAATTAGFRLVQTPARPPTGSMEACRARFIEEFFFQFLRQLEEPVLRPLQKA